TLVSMVDPRSDFLLTLFRSIFIERAAGDEDDFEDRRRFAPLIQLVDNTANVNGHQVLLKLTEVCPDHAHFWTHAARHHIYRMRGDAGTAEQYLERATNLAPTDPIQHHAYGLVLYYRIRRLIESNRLADATSLLSAIRPYYSRASEEFETARR